MPLWLDIETSVPGEVVGRLGSRWRARHAFMDHLGPIVFGPGSGARDHRNVLICRRARVGARRDECVCDARGKIRRGEPVDGNYGEIWSLWASWR
jgi:hypothetical protein